jgi:hypothetical protein
VLAKRNCGAIRAEALDEISGVEDALVFASRRQMGGERHLLNR